MPPRPFFFGWLDQRARMNLARSVRWTVAPILFFALALAVYWPGLQGGFVFDDYPNLVNNSALHIQSLDRESLLDAALSAPDGSGSRPLSMLTLGLNHYAAGLEPWSYKLTNVVIHGINGLLAAMFVYILLLAASSQDTEAVRRRAAWVACITAAAWVLHPIALTSVLYVVQRMTSLSATFVLLGLVAYSWGRWWMIRGDEKGWALVVAGLLCLPLAVLSKENGILLPVYWFILEVVFFRFHSPRVRTRLALQALFALLLLVPAVVLFLFLLANPEWLSQTYDSRDFTLDERLLTQTRVLWTYVGLILLPSVSRMGLFHDNYLVSMSLFEPMTTALAFIAWVALIVTAIVWRRRAPVAAFAVLFFLAGHTIESTALALEMFHEHRNYLPSLGILLAAISSIVTEEAGVDTLRARQLGAVVLILLLGLLTVSRATHWADPLTLSEVELAHNPDSARTAYTAGVAWAAIAELGAPDARSKREARAKELIGRSLSIDPDKVEALAALVILNAKRGSLSPDDLWDRLIAEGRRVRLNASAVDGLSTLFRCAQKGSCQLPNGFPMVFTEALLANPSLKGRFGAIVLSSLSDFFWHVENDYGAAYQLAVKAAEAAPREVVPRLNLARMLAAAGLDEAAQEALDDARERDSLGRYSRELKDIEGQLKGKGIIPDRGIDLQWQAAPTGAQRVAPRPASQVL